MKHGTLGTLWRSVTLLAVVGLIGLGGATRATPVAARSAEAAATAATSYHSNGKIAFTSNRDGNFEIYVMNPDGSAQTRLTNTPTDEKFPAWSPDGTKISFLRGSDYYVMNADGTGQTRVTNVVFPLSGPRWSPDGTKLIFGAIVALSNPNGDIYTINVDGTNRTPLTSSPDQDSQPDWSPDGSKIVFVRGGKIFVMNADGTGVAQLRATTEAIQPRWSPDGSKILYSLEPVVTIGSRTMDLLVMNADGSNPAFLTQTNVKEEFGAWSPDGKFIVFQTNADGDFDLVTFYPNANNPDFPTQNTKDDKEPDWQPLPSGTIVIAEDAKPADSTSFSYSDSIAAPNSFTLQGNTNTTKTFSDVPAGTYTVTSTLPAGWTLQDITCSDANSSGAVAAGVASVFLEPGETVTCTFKHVKSNTVIVNALTVGGNGTFPFTTSTLPGGNFQVTTADGAGAKLFENVATGNYAVSAGTLPAGWSLLETDPTCSNGDKASAISMASNEVAICSFFMLADNTIVVTKKTVGGDGAFGFTSTLPSAASFTLTTTSGLASQAFSGLAAGTYGITETVPVGWAQTGASCDNGSPLSAVALTAGDHVTCTVTNTQQANLKLVKLAGGAEGSFTFTSTIPGGASFTMTTTNTVASKEFSNIAPGTYSISQAGQIGWAQSTFTCNDGSTADAIKLDPGESVVCTIASDQAVTYLPLVRR